MYLYCDYYSIRLRIDTTYFCSTLDELKLGAFGDILCGDTLSRSDNRADSSPGISSLVRLPPRLVVFQQEIDDATVSALMRGLMLLRVVGNQQPALDGLAVG